MRRNTNEMRSVYVAAAMALLVFAFSQCMQEPAAQSDDPRGPQYAGAAACVSCHKSIVDSYMSTAHNHSTSAASAATIKGSFVPGKNEYHYKPNVKVAMEQRDSSFYQVAYLNNQEQQAFRFDVVVGSGRKAQTFLYWMNDQAFQLPVSYFVAQNSWANSPNYPPHQVRFDRNIPIGCFECHSSFIERSNISASNGFRIDHFDRNKIIYGIDCERCHGPAAKHVAFHTANPNDKNAQFIATGNSLTRQQKIDMCATCHSGLRESIRPAFGFKPSDDPALYYMPDTSTINLSDIDVHGNQVQLLAASACFIQSKTLDCNSCHNTHTTERDNLALFSQRCMNCHQQGSHNFCKKAPELGDVITSNCIDCHMPARASNVISLQTEGKSTPTANLVRTHLIGIYPDAGIPMKPLPK